MEAILPLIKSWKRGHSSLFEKKIIFPLELSVLSYLWPPLNQTHSEVSRRQKKTLKILQFLSTFTNWKKERFIGKLVYCFWSCLGFGSLQTGAISKKKLWLIMGWWGGYLSLHNVQIFLSWNCIYGFLYPPILYL